MAKKKRIGLAEEIQQSQPFSSLEEEAYLSITRTSAELSHQMDQFFKPLGITQSQYNALRILRGAGPRGLGRNEIAERMVTPTPDASRLLDRMEDAGWIRRKRGTEDRRQVTSCITAAGQRLLKKVDKPLIAFHRQQFPGIRKADLRSLLNVLADLRSRRS